jgi:hypothetical protein
VDERLSFDGTDMPRRDAGLGLLFATIHVLWEYWLNPSVKVANTLIRTLFTVVYLVLLYEQKYGDERCFGVANYLKGALQILIFRHNRLQLPASP